MLNQNGMFVTEPLRLVMSGTVHMLKEKELHQGAQVLPILSPNLLSIQILQPSQKQANPAYLLKGKTKPKHHRNSLVSWSVCK